MEGPFIIDCDEAEPSQTEVSLGHDDAPHTLVLRTENASAETFDIESLAQDVADELRAAEDQIQAHARHAAGSIVEIGRTLIRMRERLPHGQFLPWITARVGMSKSSAYRYINIAEHVPDELPTVGSLNLRTLEALASPSLPEPERASIIADLQGADPIGEIEVRERIETAKAKQPARTKGKATRAASEPAGTPPEAEPCQPTPTPENGAGEPVGAAEQPSSAVVPVTAAEWVDRLTEEQLDPFFALLVGELSPRTRSLALDAIDCLDSGTFTRKLRSVLKEHEPDDADHPFSPLKFGTVAPPDDEEGAESDRPFPRLQ